LDLQVWIHRLFPRCFGHLCASVAPWIAGKWESEKQGLLAPRLGGGVQASQLHVFAWKIRLECLPARCFTATWKCRCRDNSRQCVYALLGNRGARAAACVFTRPAPW
jgi:hypothetical protein